MNSIKSSDVWVVGFPKSGNTWISYLSSYCFNLPFENFGDPKSNQKNPWVRELTSGKNSWPSPDGFNSVKKTHKLPDQVPVGKGLVIYALRDPRDVFVSYDHFMKSKHARLPGRIRYFLLGLLGKQTQINWVIKKWSEHLNIWADLSALIVNYDKLLSEGATYLSPLFAKAPFGVDPEVVSEGVQQFSFENMSGGRAPGAEDKKSFFRKGVSGDWENHLSSQEAKLFSTAIDLYQFRGK
ncbi:MAG: sulfotransferase domain-containing protein [Candidatus Marinimicrobia bacterium]|nr:sulfotransferase domain-containing protein [Candidatus Neomarinimicrobiota bacterium]